MDGCAFFRLRLVGRHIAMNEDSELLTAEEVAKLLKVPKSWVYERSSVRSLDPLPHIKLGKYLRFRKSDVLIYLDRLKRGNSGEGFHIGRA